MLWCYEPEALHFRDRMEPNRERTPWRRQSCFINGCSFFAYSWKLPTYNGAFLLTIDNFSFFTYNWSCFAYAFSFFVYSVKVRLISAWRDCKQRSLTVSKRGPTVSKKAFPSINRALVETDLEPQKHYFRTHFGASKPAFTKARLLKHDWPVHGNTTRISPQTHIRGEL